MKKAIFLVLFVVALLISIVSYQPKLIESKITYEGFTEYSVKSLDEVKDQVSKEKTIEVDIRLNYDDFHYEKEFTDDATNEEVMQYKRDKKALAKMYHHQKNSSFMKSIDTSDSLSVYISEYTPFIEVVYDNKEFKEHDFLVLKKLSSNEKIKSITVMAERDDKYEPEIYASLSAAGAYSVYESGSETGENVTVGILEMSIVDVTHQNLVGADIEIHDQALIDEHTHIHTTTIASIITGVTGIAPGVKLLSSQLFGGPVNELDWFVEKDADIVNLSYGDTNPNGVYKADSAKFDYYAKQYNLIFVAAAGNNGDLTVGYICNPALGYNVIAIGTSCSDGYKAGYSSYEQVGANEKPNLVVQSQAVGVPNISPGNAGTSFSCAVATGMIALIVGEMFTLKLQPERLIALLTACSKKMQYYYQTVCDNGFNENIGAGEFRYDFCMDHYYESSAIYNREGTAGTVIYSITKEFLYSSAIRVAIAWFAKGNGTVSGNSITDYDINVYDANGVKIACAQSTGSNVELVHLLIPRSGNYTIQVYQHTNCVNQYGDEIGFSMRELFRYGD